MKTLHGLFLSANVMIDISTILQIVFLLPIILDERKEFGCLNISPSNTIVPVECRHPEINKQERRLALHATRFNFF